MSQTISNVDRNPPRPRFHNGVCLACGKAGRVYSGWYSVSGGQMVHRSYCLDWQACAERGGSDELTDDLGD